MNELTKFKRELTHDFLKYLDASPKTVETYTRALKQLFNFFYSKGIRQPTREDIIDFKEQLKTGHKATTIQNYIAAAKVFFKWTAQEKLYPNIAEHLKAVKITREHKKDYLTNTQIKEVLNAIDKTSLKGLRDYAILLLMVTGGLRTIEVVRANVEDLRTLGEHTVLYVQGKGREDKEFIKIAPVVEKALRDYLKARGKVKETDALFVSTSNNNTNKRITTRAVSAIVKERLINAGFNSSRLSAHSLRHSAVTLALLAGKSLQEVQQHARHANITTTMIYNHALDKIKNGCSDAIAAAIF